MDWKNKQGEIKKNSNWGNANENITKQVTGMDNIFLTVTDRWGVGEKLYSLFWWDIKVNSMLLKPELKDYTDILLMPYRVSNDVLKAMGSFDGNKWLINTDSWGISEKFPHLDPTTGNVHPHWDYKEWDGSIKQLILVKNKDNGHLGPRNGYEKGESLPSQKDCLIYQKKDKRRRDWCCSISVPSACYYPEIMDDTDLKQSLSEMLESFINRIKS